MTRQDGKAREGSVATWLVTEMARSKVDNFQTPFENLQNT